VLKYQQLIIYDILLETNIVPVGFGEVR